jgi:ethanolamine utilization protein EutQ
MTRMKLATIGMAMMLLSATAVLADPPPKPLVDSKPVKVTSADAAGPVFSSKTAVKESGQDGPGTNVLLHRSKDHKVTMGLYEAAGASDYDIDSYELDEFLFFIAGGVTMTSADGTVLEAHAGEAVAVPKGWKGHWSTKGYKLYYVAYTGGAKPK